MIDYHASQRSHPGHAQNGSLQQRSRQRQNRKMCRQPHQRQGAYIRHYLWALDQTQADATNALLKTAHQELDAQPKGPKLVVGDLNADPGNLPFLQTMCQVDGWTDLGEQAQIWGGTPSEYTCLGHNAKNPTRNDYMIANPDCLPLVKGFRVLHQEGLQVHSVLQVKLEAAQVVTAYQEPKKPKSIY